MTAAESAGPPVSPPAAPPPPGATRIAAAALLRGGAPLEPHLLVIDGPEAGRTLRLGPEQTVGRGRSADLRLADGAASRLHLRLWRVDGRFVAADLGSKNGVLVNERPCRGPRELKVGDELAIGATRLRLQPGLLDTPDSAAGEERLAPLNHPLSPTGEERLAPSDIPLSSTEGERLAPRNIPLSPTGGEGGVRGRSVTSLLAAAGALAALAAALLLS